MQAFSMSKKYIRVPLDRTRPLRRHEGFHGHPPVPAVVLPTTPPKNPFEVSLPGIAWEG
jgi:hypothetical protein